MNKASETQSKILTIIIPSYNTESFVDSVLQSFDDSRIINDLEIIFIDDGSTDSTAAKALVYKEKYPLSLTVITKENGGHGSGINTGLELASGKYIKVVDGDDYVDPEELFHLVADLKNNDVDMVISRYSTVSCVTGEVKTVQPTEYGMINCHRDLEYNKVYDSEEILPYVYASIHAITYKTDILRNNRIKMSEKTFYEDNEFVLYPIAYVKSILLSSYNVYRYRIDQNTQSIDIENVRKRINQLTSIIVKITKWYDSIKQSMNAENRQYVIRAISCQIYIISMVYLSFKEDINKHGLDLHAFLKTIKDESIEIYRYSYGRYKLVRVVTGCRGVLYNLLSVFYRKTRL